VDVPVTEGVGAGAGLGTGELGVGATGAVCGAAVADGETDAVEVWLEDEVEGAAEDEAGDGFDGALGESGGLGEGLAGELVEDAGVAAAAVTPLPRAISAAPKTAPRSLPRPVMRATL
jgi:hypothetical protein